MLVANFAELQLAMGGITNIASKLHVQGWAGRILMPSGCMQANCAELWLAMGRIINIASKMHVQSCA